jgi:crotonobetainyl-CoA:carnitine CoA-transferase CaiB-like acyl-CoA transferase
MSGSAPAYEGVTVLDMSQGVSGPYCAGMLAMQGARVVKVEPPEGDWIRVMGGGNEGMTALAVAGNLGKRSVCIDARKPEGRDLLAAMACKADVFVENFRPGVMKKLGLDYEALAEGHPELIYLSISGFGEAGPWVEKPGTDSVLQAYTGIAWLNRLENGKPKRMGMLVPDTVSALYAVQAVGAALFARARTRAGRRIEISLAQCCAAFQAAPIVDDALFHGRYKPPVAVPAGEFSTADGYLVLLTLRSDMWERLCHALGREAWLTDERFATNERRGEHAAEINRLVGEVLRTRSSAAWIGILEAHDVLCAEVQTYEQFRRHPQTTAMGYFAALAQPPYGTLPLPFLPGTGPSALLAPAPLAGQHTREVLAELGYAASEISKLEQSKVIFQREAP